MIDLTPLINAIIAAAAAAIAAFLVPYLKTKITAQQRENMAYWIEIAVAAAEEQIKGSGKGNEKLRFVAGYLSDKGYTWDEEETITLISATVWQLINFWKTDATSLDVRSAEGTE